MTDGPLHVHRPDEEAVVHHPAPLKQPHVLLQLRQEVGLGPGRDELVRDVAPARADHVDHLHAVEAADPAEQRRCQKRRQTGHGVSLPTVRSHTERLETFRKEQDEKGPQYSRSPFDSINCR